MIGIGTPKSQSRMPRPMALSFQPPFSKMYIARGRVWFPRGSRKPCASQAAPSPTQNGAGDAWVGPPCIVDAPHHCTSTRLFIWLRSRRPRVHRSPKRVPLDSFGPLGSSGFQDRRVRSDVRVVGCDLLRRLRLAFASPGVRSLRWVGLVPGPPGSFGHSRRRIRSPRWVRLDRATRGSVRSTAPSAALGSFAPLRWFGFLSCRVRRNGRTSSNLPRNWGGAAPRFRDRRPTDRRAARHVRSSSLHFRCGPTDGAAKRSVAAVTTV
jgi:hypothetical protein